MPTIGESIQVWVVPLAGQTAESWRPVLAASEWEKIMRFRFPADQVRSAATRGVLKTLLSHYLAMPATKIEFTQNEYGKPAVLGSGVEFNVSHSGDYALLAFANEYPVGIDVEHIKRNRVVSDLARRVLTPPEYSRFTSIREADRERIFFQIWTLKESVLKAIGSGLSVAPECIEIAFYPDAPKLLWAEAEEIPDVTAWTLQTIVIGDDNYAAAIAVKQRAPRIEIKRFESQSPDST